MPHACSAVGLGWVCSELHVHHPQHEELTNVVCVIVRAKVILNGMNDCNQMNCAPGGLQTVGWNTFGTGVDHDGPLGPTCNSNRTCYPSECCRNTDCNN